MASPFGLAYGIGAGLAGVPGAIEQGRERALAMSMRNLQLQQAQRQMQEQQGLDEALSMQVQPPTEQTPVYENMNTAESAPGVAAPAYRQEARGPYAPEELPSTMRVQTGTKETPHQWGSPYEQAAFELTKKAERLRQLGLGQSAQKMQEQALKYQGLHTESSLKDASRAIMAGSYTAAIPTLNKIGMDIADIHQSPTNPESVTVVRNDGTEADIPKQTIQLIGMDPNKAMPLLGTIQFRNKTLELKKAQMEQKKAEFGIKQDFLTEKHNDWLDIQERKLDKMGVKGEARTAFQKNYQFVRQLGEEKGLTGAALENYVENHPVFKKAGESPMAQTKMLIGIVNADIKDVLESNRKRIPAPGSKYYDRYQELVQKRDELAGKATAPAPQAPIPPSAPQPSQIPEGTRGTAKDGTPVVRRNGKWVAE